MRNLGARAQREPGVMAVALVRKSSKDDKKQVASLERQRGEILRVNPSIQKWWSEEGSGTRDGRDSIETILEWCRENPRPKAPEKCGRLYVWEISRFARPVYREGGEMIADALAGVALMGRFWEYGWKLVDVTTGEQEGVLHVLSAVLGMDKAGAESAKLQQRVRSGKRSKFDRGYHQGKAPWPCVRINVKTGKPIPTGEQGAQVDTILGPRPKRIALWVRLAKRFLRGATYVALADHLNERKVPTGHGKVGHWTKTGVTNLLTNVKLIGYQERRTEGSLGAQTFRRLATPIREKGNWEPMVPIGLFNAVQREVQRRKTADQRTRADTSDFLLRPTCSKCGQPFTATRVRGYRYYRHSGVKSPGHSDRRKGMMAAGCGTMFYVPADVLETEVHDRILQCRSSEEYAKYIQDFIRSKMGIVSESRVSLKRLEREQSELEAEYMAVVTAHISAQGRGLPEKPYLDKMEGINRRLQEIAAELPEAQETAAQDLNVFEQINDLMSELSAVAVGWEAATNEQRRHIFGEWVRSLAIAIEPTADGKRSSKRYAMLELRLTPEASLIDLDAFSESATSLCNTGS
ncbi:MAG TPA: recombinase family protein [Longimicrobium sp.]